MAKSSTDLCYLSLTELTSRIRTGQVSAVEATQAALDRIAALDKTLASFALVLPELALEQARQADAEIRRGDIRGPLHGAPIAVKDLCWTKGARTMAGMPVNQDFIPDEDATVVRRLREAGAVLLGKLQLTEGAFADHHPAITPPRNPWNAAHWSGASSSGSGVATAAGLCYGSLGSDTGGSIRFPSAANGVTGLKPTWGLVSRYGVFELAASLDHIGPMTRTAVDAAAMLGAIAGPDPKDPTARPVPAPNYLSGIRAGLRGLRIGFDPAWNEQVDAPTAAALAAAMDVVGDLGGAIAEIRFPDASTVVAEWGRFCAVQTAVAHEATYPSRKSEYGPGLAGLIEVGSKMTGPELQKILLHADDFSGRVQALFAEIDLLIAPAQPFASPTLDAMTMLGRDPAMLSRLLTYTSPFDVARNPTITLPCGMTGYGTPIAFQLVAGHFREDLLCRAGHAFQQATDWHQRHPAV
jgi:amidase